jgi:hypothetical protein
VGEVFGMLDHAKEVRDLEDNVARLERDLHVARSTASGKVVSLAEARRLVAEAEAPVVRALNIDALNDMLSPPGSRLVGDHPEL